MKAAIMTILISMVPVIELRGGIPYGVLAGLSVKEAMICAIIGNTIPVPFLVVFTRKVFAWLRKKSDRLNRWVTHLEEKGKSKSDVVDKYEFVGLMILVAIPLPGTGAWTGSLVAAMMDMRVKRALPSIFLGVVIAGFIVSWITYGASMLA